VDLLITALAVFARPTRDGAFELIELDPEVSRESLRTPSAPIYAVRPPVYISRSNTPGAPS
jgi:acyl CoA:acetate/3-ketoacid CoA transferase beta subunit